MSTSAVRRRRQPSLTTRSSIPLFVASFQRPLSFLPSLLPLCTCLSLPSATLVHSIIRYEDTNNLLVASGYLCATKNTREYVNKKKVEVVVGRVPRTLYQVVFNKLMDDVPGIYCCYLLCFTRTTTAKWLVLLHYIATSAYFR